MTGPVYAIGDIHGHRDALERALGWIERDGGAEARVFFTGDLVDRGPESAAVLERLMRAQAEGKPWRFVKGNHDLAFENFLRFADDPTHADAWIWDKPFGTITTLATYGVDIDPRRPMAEIFAEGLATVPADHLHFLQAMPYWLEHDALLFVHAGIRPGRALADQEIEDLVWIREPFLEDDRQHPWLIVHGHTPVGRPGHFGNRVNLDGGAGFGQPLYPVRFDAKGVWLLDHEGAEWLGPTPGAVGRPG